MRYLNKRLLLLLLIMFASLSAAGCGELEYDIPFDKDTSKSAFRFESQDVRECVEPFAANLCIPGEESTSENEIPQGPDSYRAAVLFDLKGKKTPYSRNPYERLYPASMTKVLTAIVALENGDMDQVLTANEDCVLTANDVQKVKLR